MTFCMDNKLKKSFDRWTYNSLYVFMLGLLTGFKGWFFYSLASINFFFFILFQIELFKWLRKKVNRKM